MADESLLASASPFEDPFTDTYDEIFARLDSYLVDLYPVESTRPDLRSPGLLYILLSSMASETELHYAALNEVLQLAFVQTSYGTYLDLRGQELGVDRLVATGSVGELRFMGDDGTVVPAFSTASTEAAEAGDPTYVFETTISGTVEALPDPVAAPAVTAGAAGPITGDAVYKYAYVTNLNDFDSTRGFTGATAASSVDSFSEQVGSVVIPTLSGWAPTNPALTVKAVNVYRSYKLPGIDTTFSEYKLVYTHTTDPTTGTTITDDMSDAAFLLIEETLPDSNTTGLVDVAATCSDTGLATNVIAGTVTLLDSEIPGIEAVSNPSAMTGGSDEEEDEVFAERILEEVRKPSGAGNVADYVSWAKSISGIYGVNVVPEWRGAGTVRVVVSGADNAAIDSAALIESVRLYIGGTVAISDPTAAIPTATQSAGSLPLGTYRYVYTYVNSGGGETLPATHIESVVASTTKDITLESIPWVAQPLGPTGIDRIRVYRVKSSDPASTYGLIAEVDYLDDGGGVVADILDNNLTADTSFAPPAGNSTSLYDGVAPIGASVTVETIERIEVSVDATVWPLSGYTLSGETGKTDLTAALHASLTTYFNSLDPGVDIKYMDVLNAIHDTLGVSDFSSVVITAPVVGAVSTNVAVADTASVLYSSAPSVFTEGA